MEKRRIINSPQYKCRKCGRIFYDLPTDNVKVTTEEQKIAGVLLIVSFILQLMDFAIAFILEICSYFLSDQKVIKKCPFCGSRSFYRTPEKQTS